MIRHPKSTIQTTDLPAKSAGPELIIETRNHIPETGSLPGLVAAVDLGSNTVRLLVARAENGRIMRRLVRQETTRLSQGLTSGARFRPEAVERTIRVLESYQRDLWSLQVKTVLLGATMASREAADGPEFLDRVHRDFGWETRLLSGEDEATLTTTGVMTALDPVPERTLVFDLGGRSTEFVLVSGGLIRQAVSLDLGAVAWQERFLATDPPRSTELEQARVAVLNVLEQGLGSLLDEVGRVCLVGTAGTTTTLAAMAQKLMVYNPKLIDNYKLDRDTLAQILTTMASRKTVDRTAWPGLPVDRADIIVAGATIVLTIMDFFRAPVLTVSDAGLLEGLWIEAANLRRI